MGESQEIELVLDAVRKAIALAYERGRGDAARAIMEAASGAIGVVTPLTTTTVARDAPDQIASGFPIHRSNGRQRAPRGSVEIVIGRALDAFGDAGATVRDMMEYRQSEGELMIVDSSIRGRLRRGAQLGEFREIGDKWFRA
jgi:hypothetical protein